MDTNVLRPAVVILAAGLSERIGKPKHSLRFSDEKTFLEHIVAVYQKFSVAKIVLVVNEMFNKTSIELDEPLNMVINQHPEAGRFHSIQLGLKEVKNTSVFIQNIDNPFVNPGLLINLWAGLKEADFVVPVFEGRGGHPILLSQQTVESIIKDFKKDSRFNEVLKSFNRKDVIVNDPFVTVNINTSEDYKKYFQSY